MHTAKPAYSLLFSAPRSLAKFAADEEGATAIEYGLIAALVCIIIISGLLVMRDAMNGMYSSITSEVEGTMN